jgi:ribulose 1,5-bisphosphate carboxylase large subunit-like protein
MVTSRLPLELTGELIAKEQSSGDWPHGSQAAAAALRERALARVVDVKETEAAPADLRLPLSIPDDARANGLYSGRVEIEFPNYDPACGLSNLLNVIAGEPHHLGMLTAIKLVDFHLPDSELRALFKGPRFGLKKLRQRLGVPARPLLCAPVKPATGLLPEEFAHLAYEAATGGADIIKDDELYFGLPYAPLPERARLAVAAVRRAEDETGEKKLYIANVCSDLENFDGNLDLAARMGVDGILVCPAIMGASIVSYVRGRSDLTVLSHNAMVTTMTRVPAFGITLGLWSRICKLSGADIIVMPTPYGTFGVSEAEFGDAYEQATGAEVGPGALPGFAGGKTILSVSQFADKLKSADFALVVGAALFEHPLGVKAGAASIRRACEEIAGPAGPADLALAEAMRAAARQARSYRPGLAWRAAGARVEQRDRLGDQRW